MERKEYRIRVWDTFFLEWVYINYPICRCKYTFEEAVNAAKEMACMVSASEEVQVHIITPTFGTSQTVGYIDLENDFVDCFC